LPGKLFEFMAVGLPILSSSRPPVVKILEKEKCGIVYESKSPQVIADSIQLILGDFQNLKLMGSRSIRAFRENYNNSYTSLVLKQVLDKYELTGL